MHLAFASAAIFVLYRLLCVFPSRTHVVKRKRTKSLAVFLGSGGHTTEALTLISALSFDHYSPRTYVVSKGDSFSSQKASELEVSKGTAVSPPQYTILTIPRARRVHQSIMTTPGTAFYSLLWCIYHVAFSRGGRAAFADLLILNGPGTCFVLCIAVCFNKFFGLPAPRIIYIESFARVNSLSLSGKLLYPFVDRFIVQWPQLLEIARGAEFHGLLV
ncbi:glycosyltransferase family 1 protein [Mycena belliarum]|uniref:UDP-N-acetylglucosamine transferase subunit ALG14 n=1 Tax=Mycena belliarum TaxID=1033014 RepID=A0AAD6U0W4_9AGAR|nr:glycosyltransferase family 1 protein [Mycena belliae]